MTHFCFVLSVHEIYVSLFHANEIVVKEKMEVWERRISNASLIGRNQTRGTLKTSDFPGGRVGGLLSQEAVFQIKTRWNVRARTVVARRAQERWYGLPQIQMLSPSSSNTPIPHPLILKCPQCVSIKPNRIHSPPKRPRHVSVILVTRISSVTEYVVTCQVNCDKVEY